LLSWQSFTLRGLRFAMLPGSKPRLDIQEAALTDFHSRLVITEQGRLNLRDVAAPPAAGAAASAPSGAGLPLDISVGGTQLVNGKIDVTDRLVRPNYSAVLRELNGRLGAFDSSTRNMATLDLRGRAAGTALLEIAGSLNPTAQPLAPDIRAKASDLELAPLSPCAARYAGYAIERGKLSMEVAYKIDPDGKLDAKNQVILNQLTFDDKIDSPDATKLPVLLVVALLKDRNGVIDINPPVSGSINDPQFSVFGIVLKIIGNLLVKALTDRPALKMTVTGASDPVSERELALQRGVAVRDALIAKGLPGERLFLAAPKLRASGEEDAAWTPRVQLTLSTQ